MSSGDGWLIRLRTSARGVTSQELRAVARLARVYGNGVIELTRRANLQLRGLRIDAVPQLRAELIALGLVEASPLREGRPALLVDPLAAIAEPRLAELARALDEALIESAAAGELSAKLGIVLDAGSGSVSGIDADIRVDVRGAAERVQLFVGTHVGPALLGECERAQAPAAIKVLLAQLAAAQSDSTHEATEAALSADARGSAISTASAAMRASTIAPVVCDAPRMRDLVATGGLESLRALVAMYLHTVPAPARPSMPPVSALGFHAADGCTWFGVALPFGSASDDAWLTIAGLAERFGAGNVRLTPAREALILGVRSELADELARAARARGLIIEDSDPRRRIIACSGAPSCSSAYGDTRELGAQLTPLLAAGATLHISGCSKGCASSASSALTLVLAPGGARFASNADVAAASCAPVESIAAITARLAAPGGAPMTRQDKVQR